MTGTKLIKPVMTKEEMPQKDKIANFYKNSAKIWQYLATHTHKGQGTTVYKPLGVSRLIANKK